MLARVPARRRREAKLDQARSLRRPAPRQWPIARSTRPGQYRYAKIVETLLSGRFRRHPRIDRRERRTRRARIGKHPFGVQRRRPEGRPRSAIDPASESRHAPLAGRIRLGLIRDRSNRPTRAERVRHGRPGYRPPACPRPLPRGRSSASETVAPFCSKPRPLAGVRVHPRACQSPPRREHGHATGGARPSRVGRAGRRRRTPTRRRSASALRG